MAESLGTPQDLLNFNVVTVQIAHRKRLEDAILCGDRHWNQSQIVRSFCRQMLVIAFKTRDPDVQRAGTCELD